MISYKSAIIKPKRFFLGALTLGLILFASSYSGYLTNREALKTALLLYPIWLVSTFFTDKYTHKYPQRYFTYAFASNVKAFALSLFLLVLLFLVGFLRGLHFVSLLNILLLFSFIDFLFSLPKVKQPDEEIKNLNQRFFLRPENNTVGEGNKDNFSLKMDIPKLIQEWGDLLPPWFFQLAKENIEDDQNNSEPFNNIALIDDLDDLEKALEENKHLSMIICRKSLNTVKRLNNLLKTATESLQMGGYLLVTYEPLEMELARIRETASKNTYPFRYILHFVRYRILPKSLWLTRLYFSAPFSWIDRIISRRNQYHQKRSLARAEAWGRLVFYGMKIVAEDVMDNHAFIIAKKTSAPSINRTPTYHALVTLDKVGLNGNIIKLHKIRSMYPFSEFLQKELFIKHGLTKTGKFKNDFRLTDYGPFIRKYWIDEIPGIYDWLRGEVKLVGMRATSPHYLSLYPRDVIEQYLEIKPGLIPPIFDEKTTGFDQIVQIEKTYLVNYSQRPVRTDILYFWYTFRDIFIRKVRSR